jgi:hypothetical protein
MGVVFDPLAIAETASDFTLSYLLHPERANRLIEQKAENPNHLGLGTVLDALIESNRGESESDSYQNALRTVVRYRILDHMMQLGAHSQVYPQVREEVVRVLSTWQEDLKRQRKDHSAKYMSVLISKYLKDPSKHSRVSATGRIPDGSPIGSACGESAFLAPGD